MEQWYGFGITFNSDQAIRNHFKDSSLPHFMSDSVKEELGLTKVVDIKPTHTELQYLIEGDVVEVDGVPTKQYTVVDYTAEEIATMQAEELLAKEQEKLRLAEQAKQLALDSITVTTASGKVFDGKDKDQVRMLSAIQASTLLGQTETQWKLADNSIATVTLDELREAHALAIQAVGNIILNGGN